MEDRTFLSVSLRTGGPQGPPGPPGESPPQYATAADRDAALAGLTLDELKGRVVVIEQPIPEMYIHNGTTGCRLGQVSAKRILMVEDGRKSHYVFASPLVRML